jgi:hypothetical protein
MDSLWGVKLTNWSILRFAVRRIPLLGDDTPTGVGVLLIGYAEVTVSTRGLVIYISWR